MHKICANCGTPNLEQASFCGKCGALLPGSGGGAYNSNQRTPADQATEFVQRTKVKTDELKAKTKNLWHNFSMGEKIMAGGAIAMLASFFLPWLSVSGQSVNGLLIGKQMWYVYLSPIFAVISLVFLYFSQGGGNKLKILVARWQILIGAVWMSVSLLAILAVNTVIKMIQSALGAFGSLYGAYGSLASVGIGLYLLALGSIAIVAGAFRLQKDLIKAQG